MSTTSEVLSSNKKARLVQQFFFPEQSADLASAQLVLCNSSLRPNHGRPCRKNLDSSYLTGYDSKPESWCTELIYCGVLICFLSNFWIGVSMLIRECIIPRTHVSFCSYFCEIPNRVSNTVLSVVSSSHTTRLFGRMETLHDDVSRPADTCNVALPFCAILIFARLNRGLVRIASFCHCC